MAFAGTGTARGGRWPDRGTRMPGQLNGAPRGRDLAHPFHED